MNPMYVDDDELDEIDMSEYKSRKQQSPVAKQQKHPLQRIEELDHIQDEDDEELDEIDMSEYAASDRRKELDQQQDYWKEVGKDILQQGAKGVFTGAGSAYGNLLEFLGLQTKEKTLPGQEARLGVENAILSKERPSFSELVQLSEEDEIPNYHRLATSEDAAGLVEMLGGPGEAKTGFGRFANRIGNIAGGGAAFGAFNPIPAVAGGVAGQTVEEAGGGPLAQAAAEIIGMILSQGRSANIPTSRIQPETQRIVENLRKMGHSEESIALALNREAIQQAKKASRGAKTNKAFKDFNKKSDQIANDILNTEIPGYAEGSKKVHQLASEAYGEVAERAKDIKIRNLDEFVDSTYSTVQEIERLVANNPNAREFLTKINKKMIDIIENPTAEKMIDLYKDLNSMGQWVGRNNRDRLITRVKNSIKDSFTKSGKEGQQLAEDFETVNKGIQKAYRADDVRRLMNKTVTQEGIDFQKLYKTFDHPDNIKLFESVLGPEQTKNLQQIGKIGKEIKNFDKAWKGVSGSNKLNIATGLGAGYYIVQGDFETAGKIIAARLGQKAADRLVKKLHEKSLRDPRFQQNLIHVLHAVRKTSRRTFESAMRNFQDYLHDEDIDIDLYPVQLKER